MFFALPGHDGYLHEKQFFGGKKRHDKRPDPQGSAFDPGGRLGARVEGRIK